MSEEPIERRIWLLNWREFREAIEDTDLAILPIGVNEAHGPHLPLGTDFIIPEWIAEQLAEDLNALIAPPIRYGVVTGLSGYWGSISIGEKTLESLVYDVLKGLSDNGFEKVIILNGHGGSGQVKAIENAMKKAWRELGIRSVAIAWWVLSSELTVQFFGGSGGHAGVDETAMIMAVDRSLVRGRMEDSEIYKVKKGSSPVPLPGSILAYDDGFISEIPSPEQAEEFANKVLQIIKEEVERILDGWENQEFLS